ncbi:PASTA domain-containing protein [Flavicella marina]|uniref:PASTA domain-containing protein n=1 Tax=Flavicella marina TaxID=1475951 RepID=UPI001264B95C|nr:PASTA domain-containing protein [Flavicella marina]
MSLGKYFISKQFFIQLVIVAVVFTIGFFSLVKYLEVTTKHGESIEVPDLSKLAIEEVATKLSELDLRYEVIDSASYNPNYPKKSVISQVPEKHSLVKENRKIYLTLNPSKYGKVMIQEFYGKTKYEVIAQLKSSGFEIGRILFIPDIGRNVVRRLKCNGKTLKEGDKLEKHSVIDVILGNGRGK